MFEFLRTTFLRITTTRPIFSTFNCALCGLQLTSQSPHGILISASYCVSSYRNHGGSSTVSANSLPCRLNSAGLYISFPHLSAFLHSFDPRFSRWLSGIAGRPAATCQSLQALYLHFRAASHQAEAAQGIEVAKEIVFDYRLFGRSGTAR